ncbi:hypothetical protein [Seonamhaeicola maritimus]|uniref:Uncharacterized protein n=1 Tax=Seonamhaeicola maritimus TaxID=2591822 RepID=A0A5C7GF93_9FLAO|nr:hypothetical protein [Seonamhaeicola maritimus]TXG35643.1 hypothetical protein FUA22_14150 [Seonamhaeicola maritimus]
MNTNRKTQSTIINYYERINEELKHEIETQKSNRVAFQDLANKSIRTLNILNTNNKDSIFTLKELLGATATGWELNITLPVSDEFISSNYLTEVENDSLKLEFNFISKMKEYLPIHNDIKKLQYVNTIEPFFNKHINYSHVAHELYKDNLVIGGPPTNYEILFDNMEFWNIVTFRLENITSDLRLIDRIIRSFEFMNREIEKELKNN